MLFIKPAVKGIMLCSWGEGGNTTCCNVPFTYTKNNEEVFTMVNWNSLLAHGK